MFRQGVGDGHHAVPVGVSLDNGALFYSLGKRGAHLLQIVFDIVQTHLSLDTL